MKTSFVLITAFSGFNGEITVQTHGTFPTYMICEAINQRAFNGNSQCHETEENPPIGIVPHYQQDSDTCVAPLWPMAAFQRRQSETGDCSN